MKALLNKLLKAIAYLAAGCVILLAIAVGLFRLLLPRLPSYQEEIKGWANAAIGMQVEFSGMNARWRFSGPELNFYNAELTMPGSEGGAFAADEVSIGVDLMQLVIDRRFVVDRVLVRDSAISVSRDDEARWRVQDIPLAQLGENFAGESGGHVELIVEDFDVALEYPPGGASVEFTIANLRVVRSPQRVTGEAVIALPATLGNRLSLGLSGRPADDAWQLTLQTRALELAGWSRLQPASLPALSAGRADLGAALEVVDGHLRNGLLEFDLEELLAAGSESPFAAEGRLEYSADEAGWLLAADGLRLSTERGIWPESSFNVQGGTGAEGRLTSLSADASFVDLDDLGLLLPWLPERAVQAMREYGPTGQVADLSLTLQDLGSERPRYDLALELSGAGVLATERWPGLRGFSGSLRANRSGGRVEIDSADLALDLSRWMEAPLGFSSARGTVIWRRNADGIIVLSDSIRVQNADLASRSSVQLSLPADDSSPVLDVESRFSIYDLAAARAYLPGRVMNPALYRWLDTALVAGSVPAGVAGFSGRVGAFPFDDGEGVFRIEAELEDATLRYSSLWPDVDNLDMDLVVDRVRLYSERNTATNAGNSVVDAKIEIADLRDPVLTIDAFATGTLESVRRFARESPIAGVFGGQLDRVSVAGEASFSLDLRYPLRRRDEFSFTTRLQASDGTLRIAGLTAPVTELNGFVTVTRDTIGAESLEGRFLCEPVSIRLQRAGDELPGYSVVAEADGRFTAAGLREGFGVDLGRIVAGETPYRASVRFPRAGSETPAGVFSVVVESGLEGLAVSLPPPLGKPAERTRRLLTTLEFPTGNRIQLNGSLDDELRWSLGFIDGEQGWDFDRGVVAAGAAEPGVADTRGLHIVGAIDELHLADWLDVAGRRGDGRAGGGDAARIRSIDLQVANLHVVGQHYLDHRVLVDRSGSDWRLRLEGEQAIGSVSIPYDLDGERPIALDMQRLVLPGSDDSADANPISADPRQMPAVSLRADEFALGERYLGRLSADFTRRPDGLVADALSAEDATFRVDGSAGWVVDVDEPSGQRTWVDATLVSSDVATTFERLDTKAGIEGDEMQLGFDVSWSGGPRGDFLDSLDGEVVVRFGPGQLNEVDPGAGRVFGLLSVVALPRRLALDFRDVLDKGFAFDEITGTFRLDDGAAYTCDLSLKGPAADIGIVGRAGLIDKDYTQSAIVSANVGNTLPVVGAVVAGPQVAAALLIFSQIFKKPLQEMGQVYYEIEGAWDNPDVDSADARRFAEISRMAGCLASNE